MESSSVLLNCWDFSVTFWICSPFESFSGLWILVNADLKNTFYCTFFVHLVSELKFPDYCSWIIEMQKQKRVQKMIIVCNYVQTELHMFKHKIYLGLYLSIFCTFPFIFDILLHIYLISFSFFPHDLHHVGKHPIFELSQWQSSLLSPSQLVAADFCSGSCLLAQTDTLLFFSPS